MTVINYKIQNDDILNKNYEIQLILWDKKNHHSEIKCHIYENKKLKYLHKKSNMARMLYIPTNHRVKYANIVSNTATSLAAVYVVAFMQIHVTLHTVHLTFSFSVFLKLPATARIFIIFAKVWPGIFLYGTWYIFVWISEHARCL